MVTPSTVRWPRVMTPSHMVQLIKQQKNPLNALHLFDTATLLYPSSIYSPTPSVYSALVSSLSSSPSLSLRLPPLLLRMAHSPSPSLDSSFSLAIPSLPTPLLLPLLSGCPRWPLSFHSALYILLSRGDLRSAHHLLDEMPHCPLPLPSLNLLISSLCQLRRPDLALQIFAEIPHHCLFPDQNSYRILMRGLCDLDLLGHATHLLRSMLWRVSRKGCVADVVTYRTLLHSLCRAGRLRDAEDLLAKVLLKPLRSPGTRRSFRKPELLGADAEETKRRIDSALVGRGVRSSKSYSAMVVDLYGEGEVDTADKMFEGMIGKGFRPTVAMYEARVAGLCGVGRAEDALRVVEMDMKERGCVPRARTYELVMEAFCDEGKSRKAVELLGRMERQVGCVARKETFEILVSGLLREGLFVETASVLETMARRRHWPGAEMYSRAIEGFCSTGRRYEAVVWLEEMVSQGKMPEICVWRSLVSSVCLDHDRAEVVSSLDDLTSEWMEIAT